MREIAIDIETYSSNDLPSCGVYKYVEAEDFRVLLFAYSVDGGEVRICDIEAGEELPPEIRAAITDDNITKTAYNATFERVCLSRYLGLDKPMPATAWRCTMVQAARMGLPLSLAQCSEVLQLEHGKMKEGAALIRHFSVPNRKGGRNLPSEAPDKWEQFKAYCVRDVEVEQAVRAKVCRLTTTATEDELYIADQEINDRGVLIDMQLAENAARLDEEYKAHLLQEAKEMTGLENPNSPAQIKAYLNKEAGYTISGLNKADLAELEQRLHFWPKAQRIIQIRKELGKTSNKKYAAMAKCVCRDGRIRGLLQFYGANRTGRWAGRLVQIQNLPQNHLADIDTARAVVKGGDIDELELYYDNPMQVVSELIRTAFIAEQGKVLHVCDFSAIEARVIAWLAGEQWVLDVFNSGGDIYCAAASQMFGVPVDKHGANADLRQKGKIAVLALGYGGGVNALKAMGGERMGLSESEMREIVQLWRRANTKIVKLWGLIEQAAMTAISTGKEVRINRGLTFAKRWGMLIITLPSGRALCYPRARIGREYSEIIKDYKDTIEYEGVNQTTKNWESLRTYGGKLTENVVQAIARDILAEKLLHTRREGYDIAFHVHDEVVTESDPTTHTLEQLEAIFSEPLAWCKGLPLQGAGYSTPYYLKD